MRPDELERRLRERLDALGPAPANRPTDEVASILGVTRATANVLGDGESMSL